MSSVAKTPQTRLQGRRMAGRPLSQTDEIPMKFAMTVVGISIVTYLALAFGFFKFHKSFVHLPRMTMVTDRLIYTLQMQAFTLIPLFICVPHVIFTRIQTGTLNPMSGHEGFVEKPVRIMTNTLEQTVLTVMTHLVLATYLPADYMIAIPFLVFSFVVGRILFFVGYNIHPKYRGLGFSLAYSSTCMAFLACFAYATGLMRMMTQSSTSKHSEL